MRKVVIIFIFFFICTMILFSFDFAAYYPMEIEELIEHFNTISISSSPGLSIFNNRAVRIRAILHELPKEIEDNDLINIRSTLQSLGFDPNEASNFGYKIEYIFPSVVDWQEETKLVFFIQSVQRSYFERDFELNDTVYWFAVYRQFSTFSQTGYFIISVFLSEEWMKEYNIE